MQNSLKEITISRVKEILKRYGMSISSFSNIIGKDRRTLTSWLDGKTKKDIGLNTKVKICEFFRYPMSIWSCNDSDFMILLESISTQNIRIVDEGYEGSLRYMLSQEAYGRFVVQPRFPAPAYRDIITQLPQNAMISYEAKLLMQERSKKIRSYKFRSTEWYSIESLLYFAFCVVGNPYTQQQKLSILQNLYEIFHDNPNKKIYLFDSTANGIFHADMNYTSIVRENGLIFFRLPFNALIVEIANANITDTIYNYFEMAKNATNCIKSEHSMQIIMLLLESIRHNDTLLHFYDKIQKYTNYATLFANNISEEYRQKGE